MNQFLLRPDSHEIREYFLEDVHYKLAEGILDYITASTQLGEEAVLIQR